MFLIWDPTWLLLFKYVHLKIKVFEKIISGYCIPQWESIYFIHSTVANVSDMLPNVSFIFTYYFHNKGNEQLNQ